jgi:hypothetical protein
MAAHVTQKSTPAGRQETLRRREIRSWKRRGTVR